jgi:amino acid adenylation domain-containing protein
MTTARTQVTRRRGIPRREGADAPLSPAQLGVWTAARMREGSTDPYVMAELLWLRGPLDLVALTAAFADLAARHEALRTRIVGDAPPRQVVDPPGSVHSRISVLDLPDDRVAAVCALTAEGTRGFDLDGPLWRVVVVRTAADEHLLLFALHHLMGDEWSMDVLHRDLVTAYTARVAGQPVVLEPLAVQYADYADWQSRRTAEDEKDLAYWRSALDGMPHELDFPTDSARDLPPTHLGTRVGVTLSPRATTRLRALAARAGTTPFAAMTALWGIVLARHCGQDDLLLGAAVSNRTRSETEDMVGMFAGLLPLPVRLAGAPTITDAVRRVAAALMGALDHQNVTLDRIATAVGVARGGTRPPLCQAAVSWSVAGDRQWRLGAVTAEPVPAAFVSAKVELLLAGVDEGSTITLDVIGERSLFDEGSLRVLLDHVTQAVDAACAEPASPVSELSLMSERERVRIANWAGTEVPSAAAAPLGELVDAACAAHPDRIAVTAGTDVLTYAELAETAMRWAHALRAAGVRADSVVGVAVPRSAALPAILLAVLKAGGAYLALDHTAPAERTGFYVRDSGAKVVVATAETLPGLGGAVAGVSVLLADAPPPDVTGSIEPVHPDALAFLCYTSGSTGTPKCVGLTHRNVARVVHRPDYLPCGPRHAFLQLAPIGFDISAMELWTPLIHGGRLVLAPPGRPDLPELAEYMRAHGVTTMVTTTALFHQIVAQDPLVLAGLAQIAIGGDVAAPASFTAALEHPALRELNLVHCYGPTENTCTSTSMVVRGPLGARVPIGGPITGSTVHVLDENLRPVPVGVTGQLCTGGTGVTRGYLTDAAMTAARFIPDPFSATPGARLYLTGDLARWRPDGTLEFAGRMDRQVKVRGFRVEPGEIEARLARADDIAEAVVDLRADHGGHRRLVAYVVPKPGTDPGAEALRRFVARTLPEYMVPAAIVAVPRIPLTANGKIDRVALPEPVWDAPPDVVKRAPANPVEAVLVSAWSQVLGVADVGVDDNFFALGGDSILSIRIAALARESGVHLSSSDVFDYQTVAELATAVANRAPTRSARGATSGLAPLTPIQHWFHDRGAPRQFNQSVRLRTAEPLDAGLLGDALNAVVAHHDALRLRLVSTPDGPRQRCVQREDHELLELVDELNPAVQALQRSVDPVDGPLLRAVLAPAADDPAVDELVLVAHHLAVDTVSWDILLRDLETAYHQVAAGRTPRLAAPPTSYLRWAHALAERAADPAFAVEAHRWWELAAAPDDLVGCFGEPGPSTVSRCVLDEMSTAAVLALVEPGRRGDTTAILLTALTGALAEWTGGRDFVVDVEGHGREALGSAVDVSGTVGWFTALYPVALRLPPDPANSLVAVREQVRAQPPGTDYGLARYLRDPDACWPSPTVAFNYHGHERAGATTLLTRTDGYRGDDIDPAAPRPHAVEFNTVVADERLHVHCTHPATADGLDPAALFVHHARRLAGRGSR